MKRRTYIRILLLVLLAIKMIPSWAQPKLSPYTIRALQQQQYIEPVSYKAKNDNEQYVGALIKVAQRVEAETHLRNMGAHIGTRAGDVWTVRVPISQLKDLATLRGVSYVQMNEPVVKPQMNVVRTQTRVDSVVNALAFDRAYTGKGVVVGVIDFGFDYNHPANYDTSNSYFRLVKVWEQGGIGTPPQGYTYGRELADTSQVKAATTDNDSQTHGTNVAGIAAGSGVGSNLQGRQHRGVAFDAEMVFVCVRRDSIEQQWKEGSFTDFVDAVAYIFNYATSVQKPCVINISWGSHSGPHNGTTLLNEALDNLTGAGKIVVLSAGNDGGDKIYFKKTFTPTDTVASTFLRFTSNNYKRTWVDSWGEQGKQFCVKVSLIRNDTSVAQSPFVCSNNQTLNQWIINDAGDTCYLDIVSISAEHNGQPRITADIFNLTTDTVLVTFTAIEGTVHTWNEYYYYGYNKGFKSTFDAFGKSWASDGSTDVTVNDMGSGKHMILVGAYVSRTGFRNIAGDFASFNGTIGGLTGFSSRGPLTDGRIKPDITAPGLTLASPVSSFDPRYQPGGSTRGLVVNAFTNPVDNKVYNYSEFTGTSASGPVVSGIVALMLEANPGLFPFQVRNALATSAITDQFTGTLPAGGNNTWGFGKVNATGAVAEALRLVGLASTHKNVLPVVVFPNPAQAGSPAYLHIDVTHNMPINIEVFDMQGRCLKQQFATLQGGLNELPLQVASLAEGVYLIRIHNATVSQTIKLMVK